MCRVRAQPVGDQRPAAVSSSDGRGDRGPDAPEAIALSRRFELPDELLPDHLRDALRRTVQGQVERHARLRASMAARQSLPPTTPRRRP